MVVSILIECCYRTGGSEADGHKEGGKFMSTVLVLSVHRVVLCLDYDCTVPVSGTLRYACTYGLGSHRDLFLHTPLRRFKRQSS
jgi:hypothetical protein